MRMRRNGYLWTFGVNLDTAVWCADPDFLLECKMFAIWRHFPLIFAFYMLNVHHIYDHTLPIYNVFVCWYVTYPCDLDFWPFDHEQLLCMAGHVTNLATKQKDPTPNRSWVMSDNVSHWLPLKMRKRSLRMWWITWPISRGWKTITFLESATPICLSTIFGGSTMNIIKVICENNARPCVKRLWVSAHARNHVIC